MGGAGNDTYIVDSTGDIVVETSATGGNDTIESYISYTLPTKNVENITLVGEDEINATGNEGVNKLVGNDSANQIDGKGGKDTIEAGDGDDTLIGGAGSDLLKAMEGNDSLSGDAGDDSLNGGEGDDTIDGGAENDILVLSSTSENYQFEAGENDGETLVTYSDSEGEAGDGVDVISNVEFVQFSTGSKVKLADLLKGVVPNPDNGNTGNTGNENPQPTNHNPVATNDSYKDLTAGTAITKPVSELLANDSDSDKDSLSITSVNNASGGTVSLDNSKTNFTFTPNANAQTGSFQYGISDGNGETATATVNLTFKAPAPTQPVASSPNDKILPAADKIANTILGTKNADTLNAKSDSSETQYLVGFAGDDTLISDSKYSVVAIGGSGNDIIKAKASGNFIGGSGIDHFYVNNESYNHFYFGTGDTGVGVGNRDIIEGFSTNNYIYLCDISRYQGSDANIIGFGGKLTYVPKTTIYTADFTAKNQVRYESDPANNITVVQINTDDDLSTVEAEIELTGLVFLTASNFILG